MGLFKKIEKELGNQFSIFDVMSVLGMDREDLHECRNLLRQWYQQNLIKRIGKNMYIKVNEE